MRGYEHTLCMCVAVDVVCQITSKQTDEKCLEIKTENKQIIITIKILFI